MLTTALHGLKVVEVATYIPGPVCGRMLAGMGARVTKIERPGGDPMRSLPPLDAHGISPMFAPLNEGKILRELDLKDPAGRAELVDLLRSADILIDGLRPGALARQGFAVDSLHAANPGLIICAISAFGLRSPNPALAGHDLNFAALSGFLALNSVDGTPAMPGAQITDMLSGLTATTAIMAGLQLRAQSGRGMLIDASMAAASTWLMQPWYAVAQSGALSAAAPHTLNGELACYRIYRCADGRHLAVAALETHFWERFCQAIERPELIAEQHVPSAQASLIAAVQQAIGAYDLAHWEAIFARVEACVSAVRSLSEAADQPVDLRLPAR